MFGPGSSMSSLAIHHITSPQHDGPKYTGFCFENHILDKYLEKLLWRGVTLTDFKSKQPKKPKVIIPFISSLQMINRAQVNKLQISTQITKKS